MTDNSRKARVLTGMLVVVVSVLPHAPPSFTQTVTGRILGTVRDQQGAVIPNAQISCKNL